MIKRIIPITLIIILLIAMLTIAVSAVEYTTQKDFKFDIQFIDTSGNTSIRYEDKFGDVNIEFPINGGGAVNINQGYAFWLDTTAFLSDGGFIAQPESHVTFELSGVSVYIADETIAFYNDFKTFDFSIVLCFADGTTRTVRTGLSVTYNNFTQSLIFSGEFDAEKPITAIKFALYGSPYQQLGYAPGNTSDVAVRLIGRPLVLISTEARKDAADKIGDILEGDVTPTAPAGSGTVGDLENAENNVSSGVGAAVGDAEQVIQGSTTAIYGYADGFLFLTTVVENLLNVGWIRPIVLISLSLGIFGFITNLITSIGRSIESHSKKERY